MTALTPDIRDLCHAIDAGANCLMELADALEEAGDARAADLRHRMIRCGWGQPKDVRLPGGLFWGWQCGWGHTHSVTACLAGALDERTSPLRHGDWRLYPTRSAAFLALSEALTQE